MTKHKPVKTEFRPSVASPLKKKATFNLNASLHQKLKIAAAVHRREMVDIVEDAIQAYLPALEKKAGNR